MKQLRAVHPDDSGKVMRELTRELQPIIQPTSDPELREAQKVYLGTLFRLTLKLIDWLPSQQQNEILTACGTWFDIGLMMGRAPLRLVNILKTVNPRLVDAEIPDWVGKSPATDDEGS